MRITKLRLEGYKRLMLSNIQYIEYTPTAALQLIIGRNGTGKSSILEELTPLPSHHTNFTKGGSKYIACEHQGQDYTLSSVYNSGTGTHSFKRGEEELNQGGTAAIQRELVERTFGITREIHELLVGITTFSGLSTAKRREWLTRMSPVNLDYAFDLYNRARSQHRDQQGVIRHLTKRMTQESQDVPSESEMEYHSKAVERLTAKVNSLWTLRQADLQSQFRSDDEVREQYHKLIAHARKLLISPPTLPSGLQVTSPTALDSEIQQINVDLEVERGLLDRLTHEHEEVLRQTPKQDEVLSVAQIQVLKDQLAQLETKIANTKIDTNDLEFPLVELGTDGDPQIRLKSVWEEWIGLMHNFPNNSDGRFSPERGVQAQERLKALTAEHQHLSNQHDVQTRRLARLKGCETVHCPNCEHSFTPGVDPQEVTALTKQIHKTHTRLVEADSTLTKLKEYLESFNDYTGFVRAFKRLVDSTTPAGWGPLWDYCVTERIMYVQPKNYIPAATNWFHVMQQVVELRLLEQQRDVLEHKLRYVLAIDQDSLTQLDKRLKELEASIGQHTESSGRLQEELQSLQRFRQQMVDYTTDLNHTADLLVNLRSKLDDHVNYLYQEAVREETNQTQVQLAQHQSMVSKIDVRDAVLKDMRAQHDESLQDLEALRQLVRAMSPMDGLIGRYLMGFMQSVVQLINAIISEIWTYPLEVLPSKVERDELDYKFPLNVNNGAVSPPDIALGSSSQVDVVNFAFKLLVMKFLGLEDFPLYLDEFGSSFDEQHRENLIPFINRMIALGQVSQIFFISHFSATHGAFTQAEVCVIDPTNITVPQVYNKHVVIR